MIDRRTILTGLALGALIVGAPTDARAQAPEAPDREELVDFTEAFVEIAEVREEMSPQILDAESQEEAAALQTEANEQMLDVLADHELQPERYNSITQLLNTDTALREEFEAILEEIEGGTF